MNLIIQGQNVPAEDSL